MSFMQPRMNSAQYRFLEGMSPGGTGLFVAGVGIGKSTLMREVACILAAYNPGVTGMFVSHVLLHTRTSHLPPLIQRLKEYRNFDRHVAMDRTIHCRNGAKIQYGSADRPDTLDGFDAGWLLCDEIRYWRESAHEKATARVRDHRAKFPFIGLFTTPEMGWMYDTYREYDAPGFYTVRGSTLENLHNLRPGYYDDLKARYSPRTFKQYVEGHWGLVEGAVYEDFDADTHVCDLEHDPRYPVHCALDFGYRCPAALFFQHIPRCEAHRCDDCIHILDELIPDNTTTESLAPMVRGMYNRYRWRVGLCYVDPAGTARSQEVGYSSVDILESHGLECEWTYAPASRHIPAGIDAIRKKLRDVDGTASLYISNRCGRNATTERGIVRGLSRCEYPPRKPGQSLKDEPIKDKFTHILDALRYGIVNLFPPTGSGITV